MSTNDTPETIEVHPKRTKRPRSGGRQDRVTLEIVDEVAAKVCVGVPLTYALASISKPISLSHWNKSLNRAKGGGMLLARYMKRCGLFMEETLKEISLTKLREMPAKVWILERRWPEFFSTKVQNQHNTTVNICLGLPDEIGRRAAQIILTQGKQKPKQIEIESSPAQDPS